MSHIDLSFDRCPYPCDASFDRCLRVAYHSSIISHTSIAHDIPIASHVSISRPHSHVNNFDILFTSFSPSGNRKLEVLNVLLSMYSTYESHTDPPTTRDTGEDIEVKEVKPYLPSDSRTSAFTLIAPTSSHMLHLMHRSHHMY